MLQLTNVFRKNAEAYTSGKYEYIINQGGSRSSKTFSILQLLVEIARKHKKQIDIVGISVPHLKMGVLNDMPKVMEGFGLDFHKMYKITEKSIQFPDAGVINFIAVDKLGTAHGGARDILYVNEGNHHKYPIIEQLMMRTSGIKIIDFNPTGEFWAHTILKEHPDKALLIKSTYKDNQFLSKSIVEFIESKKGDGTSNFWRVYGLGELGVAEGLIFDNFTVEDFDIYDFDKYLNGVDWGFSQDPYAFVRCAIKQNTLFICQEIYQKGLLNKDSAELIKPIVRNETVWCDSAEPKSVQEYVSLGIKAVPVKKGAGSIESGIKKIQAFDRVIIHPSCVNTADEFKNYQWKQDKNGAWLPEPAGGFDHILDAIRYALNSEMNYKKPTVNKPDVSPHAPHINYGGTGWLGL